MKVKASQAAEMIANAIKVKLVPMLWGSPGIGKSHIVYQIAERYNLFVIDLRLSQCDPTDLGGFPTIIGERADYMPMKHFPIEGDPLPINPKTGKPYSGWLLFLDEATGALPAIQVAAYKLVLDRMVGSHHLHSKVAIVLAGNMETDGAVSYAMSTALQSRLVHLELEVDLKEWIDWAHDHDIHHWLTDFIQFMPSYVYTFKPDHEDHTYACPRTWEFADRLIKSLGMQDDTLLPLLAGTISEGIAREFLVFCKIYQSLPQPKEIAADPENTRMPSEKSVLYALTGSLAQSITKETANAYMTYITRMPMEFQVLCMNPMVKRSPFVKSIPAVQKWISDVARAIY
jgi:hypothetical protein